MPSRDYTYRIGNLVFDGEPPTVEELNNILEQRSFEGQALGERRGIRDVVLNRDEPFVYFVYEEEQLNEYTGWDENNEYVERRSAPVRSMKIIIDNEQNMVFESVRGISPYEAIKFVLEDTNYSAEVKLIESLDRKILLNFYEDVLNEVKKFKVKDIGDHEPNPIDVSNRARDILETFGDVVEYSENSVGREGDTKDEELAEGMIGTSDPHMIRGEDEDGRIREVKKSNRFTIRYDEEQLVYQERVETDASSGHDEEGRIVREFAVESILRHL